MRFRYVILTHHFPDSQLKALQNRCFGLTEKETEEFIKVALIKQLQNMRIGQCDVVEWDVYQEPTSKMKTTLPGKKKSNIVEL